MMIRRESECKVRREYEYKDHDSKVFGLFEDVF